MLSWPPIDMFRLVLSLESLAQICSRKHTGSTLDGAIRRKLMVTGSSVKALQCTKLQLPPKSLLNLLLLMLQCTELQLPFQITYNLLLLLVLQCTESQDSFESLSNLLLLWVLQRMAEHDQVRAEEVEGANDFLRATKQEHESLRRRPIRPQNMSAVSVQGNTSENV